MAAQAGAPGRDKRGGLGFGGSAASWLASKRSAWSNRGGPLTQLDHRPSHLHESRCDQHLTVLNIPAQGGGKVKRHRARRLPERWARARLEATACRRCSRLLSLAACAMRACGSAGHRRVLTGPAAARPAAPRPPQSASVGGRPAPGQLRGEGRGHTWECQSGPQNRQLANRAGRYLPCPTWQASCQPQLGQMQQVQAGGQPAANRFRCRSSVIQGPARQVQLAG